MKAHIDYTLRQQAARRRYEQAEKESKVWAMYRVPGTGRYEVWKYVDRKQLKTLST